MVLSILRGAFILLVMTVAALYLLSNQLGAGVGFAAFALIIAAALALAGMVVGIDTFSRHKRLSAISGVFLGLIAGLVVAYALSFVVDLVGLLTVPEVTAVKPDRTEEQIEALPEPERSRLRLQLRDYQDEVQERQAYLDLFQGVKVVIGLISCYLGISLVLQTKDDFRFVIPYVEFAKQIRGNRPTLLDTSVIVDGRVLDIIETRIMQGTLVVPKFVLNELQAIADSADKLRRARGRRGLEILQKLRESTAIDVLIEERDPDGVGVDQKLIALAQEIQGRVMTNDFNLNKIATLRGVDVINLNDLAKAMRPVVLPGEQMTVKLVKPGESPSQGVGYLDDGTMVVVELGRAHLGEDVDLTVTSTLQTSAGRMIFGRLGSPDAGGSAAGISLARSSGRPSVGVSGGMSGGTSEGASGGATSAAEPASPAALTDGSATSDPAKPAAGQRDASPAADPLRPQRSRTGRNPRRSR